MHTFAAPEKSDPDLRFCGNYLSGNLRDTGIFGVSAVYVQYLAIPHFESLPLLSGSDEYRHHHVPVHLCSLDYLMVIRACSFLSAKSFLTADSLHLAVRHYHTDPRTPHCLLYGEAAERDHGQSLCHTGSCDLETAWLLPFSTTMIIFLLTGNIRDGSFNQAHLIARILLLVCMFLTSHTQILLLQFFRIRQRPPQNPKRWESF